MPGPVFLYGDRIELRTVEAEDLDFLQETINDPNVRRFLGSRSPINGEQEREWYEERASDTDTDHVHLLICRDGEAMGTIGLHPHDSTGVNAEIGISLAEEFWGEGYGTEASRLITDFGFRERRHHRIFARVFEGNVGSARIWEKLGFRHEATHVEAEFLDGEYVNVERYAVLEDEWFGEDE
ncbi:GNAT family protein [Haladaptatus sp. T7]|uniref:GNAT family N-acetyltransferase n=1 Tax=Haladaptatus sp. T7 TaxID=2029368 RepID=UPI0021A25265|nr:GNAT family protein [Haladaptatus sp. T7]GKZ13207.1 N-acetyltransferase [Haladaptatus sp. T7]